VDLVYDDTYDQGLEITDDDVDVESEK
jgi:hypothetical protein